MALLARLSAVLLLGCLTAFWWASRVAASVGADVGATAGFVVHDLSSLFGQAAAEESDFDEEEGVGLGTGAEETSGSVEAAALQAKKRRAGARHHLDAPPAKLETTFVVSAAQVLALANAGRRPSGYAVRAEGKRPSGIALSSTNGLGLPVIDGDVLTHVEGQHVRTPGDVVGLVLALRGRKVPSIFGIFWRAGKPFGVSVEQPYVRRD